MARKRRRVNRKRKENIGVPTTSIVEFASSTANLMIKMVKMAGDNDCVSDAFTAFRNQIGDVLDDHQRDLMESLFYECHKDLEYLRGSEKSTSKGPIEINAVNREAPEPVPKETEKTIAAPRTVVDDDINRSLFGYGVKESEAPGKFMIDKLLEKGVYTKGDIIKKTEYHKDTVRKRITYIQKHIPEVYIEYLNNPNPSGGPPILRAIPMSK